MTKKLYDYDVGENVSLFVLIKTSETRIAKNGNKFIAINFSDKSGVISAKFWDASAKDIEQFKAGNVVYLKGKRENYQRDSIKNAGANIEKSGSGIKQKVDSWIDDGKQKLQQIFGN